MNYKKFAFTLAETLVTLTVIGVVMTLMLRSINRVVPNKDKLLFLKSYRALEIAVANIINDPTKYDQSPSAMAHKDFSDSPLPSATASACEPGAGAHALCCFLADELNTISVDCGSGKITSSNGVVYEISGGGPFVVNICPSPKDGGSGDVKVPVTIGTTGHMSVSGKGAEWLQSATSIK